MTPTDYQTRFSLPYPPSDYQTAIFEAVENGRGNLVVEAVAGSGKSTTLEIAARLARDVLVVAFNKAIADSMGKRLASARAWDATARTAHSVGIGAIRYANRDTQTRVDDDKYHDLVRVYEQEVQTKGTLFGRKLAQEEISALYDENSRVPRLPMGPIINLLRLARLNLVDFDNADSFLTMVVALCDHHGFEIPAGTDAIVAECVRRAALAGRDNIRTIDFVDMVWMPVVHDYQPKRYSWLFVDECQDISPCILALLHKCLKRGGRMLFVGDRRQAIYGFAGADARSFANIIEATNATLLPLSVCYRCPTSVLDRARAYCPQIEARPGAPEGVVRRVDLEELTGQVREGDMLLCRKNAPLVKVCFGLIAEGIAATIRGRDIGKGLVNTIRKIGKRTVWDEFATGLATWRENEVRVAIKRGGSEAAIDARIQGIDDKAECIRIIYASSGTTSYDDLTRAVESLFSDHRSSVTLSTIHKAKGLENDRVFILGETELVFRNQQAWQVEQERNLSYVAYTRAMNELVFVDMPE
jgi:DNA helicase-2/ATP-dependent DNA helicase PcrA